MEVIVGTYNHVLFGFSFGLNEEDNSKWSFKPLFTDQGHAGCIKSVSTSGRYLASGSTDETIRLFDLKKHTEVGTLVQQDGSITCLTFSGTTHMLSGSEDGTICIWKTKTWELEKTMKGHKASINAISIHPTGRLALSVSKDKTIRTWNLLTGRTAYTTGLKEVGEIVHWSPSGDAYAIVVGSKVTVYQIKGVKDPVVYKCEKPILAMVFLSADVLVLGGESSDIIVYNFQKKLVLQRIAAHKVRTKGLNIVPYPGEDENKVIMFTVASSGNLKAWVLDKSNLNEEAQFLASLDLPGRPTCLTVKPQIDNNIKATKVVVEAVKADKETPVSVQDKEVDSSADDKVIQSENVDSTSEGVENEDNKDAENSIGSLSIKSSHESLDSTEIGDMQSENVSPDEDMEKEEKDEEEEEIEKDKENTPVSVDSPVDSPTHVDEERSSTKSSLSVGTVEADSTTESESMSLSKESTMESITGSTTDSLMDTSSSQASEDSTSKSTSVKSTTVKKGKKKKKFDSDSSSISSSTKEVKKKKKKKSINVGD